MIKKDINQLLFPKAIKIQRLLPAQYFNFLLAFYYQLLNNRRFRRTTNSFYQLAAMSLPLSDLNTDATAFVSLFLNMHSRKYRGYPNFETQIQCWQWFQ